MPATDEEWAALLARIHDVRRRATEYAAIGKPVRFRDARGHKLLVSPSLEVPGQWRVTTFGADGLPWGHYGTRDAYEAFREVLTSQGNVPD